MHKSDFSPFSDPFMLSVDASGVVPVGVSPPARRDSFGIRMDTLHFYCPRIPGVEDEFFRNTTTKGGNAMRCPLCNLNNVNLIYDMKNFTS